MITVKNAKRDDFDAVYSLLLEFNDQRLTKDDWQRLFINHFGASEDYFGFMALDNGNVVGFIGLIFCERPVNGKTAKFCNISSWIVKKEYQDRGIGSLLFLKVVKLMGDYTITALNPGSMTIPAYQANGYQELESRSEIILPVPSMAMLFDKCSVVFDLDDLEKLLNDNDRKIYQDHLSSKCLHFAIVEKGSYCYVIAKTAKVKKMPMVEIHYLGDLDLFLRHIAKIRINVCLQLMVCGLLIDQRILRGEKVPFTINCGASKYFKSAKLGKEDITDNLYSELFVLPI